MQENTESAESPKKNDEIKVTIECSLKFDDKSYSITFDRGVHQELAANMIAREGIKFAKQNLIESVKQAKGKALELCKDRLGKVTSCEYILGMLIEQMIGEILVDKELSAESGEKEMGEILPEMPVMDDLSADNSEKVGG